ncbi:MAG: flagellar biosynthesis regulator FlaF [Pseudomonadota bacterium]
MNATQLAQTAYGSGTRSVRTPRGVEYEAFARITSRLKAVAAKLAQSKRWEKQNNTKAPLHITSHFGELTQALSENGQLWTLLAADVADSGNGLPDELRAGILSLAEFTRQHTLKVLKSEASVVPLLEINIAIMRGLSEAGLPQVEPQEKARAS